MAWTTPRTWVTSEIVSAAIMNVHVRDNLNDIYSRLSTVAQQSDITAVQAELGTVAHVPSGGLRYQSGSSVVTTDGNAQASVGFPVAFSSLTTVVLTNGDNGVANWWPYIVTMNAGYFTFFADSIAGGRTGLTCRINWIATGS